MDIYTATRGFATMHKGERKMVHQGDTTVEGHWLLKQCADAFEPLEVTHPLAPARVRAGKTEGDKEPDAAAKAAAGGKAAS